MEIESESQEHNSQLNIKSLTQHPNTLPPLFKKRKEKKIGELRFTNANKATKMKQCNIDKRTKATPEIKPRDIEKERKTWMVKTEGLLILSMCLWILASLKLLTCLYLV